MNDEVDAGRLRRILINYRITIYLRSIISLVVINR